MFDDDLLLPPPIDMSDCLQEIYELRKYTKKTSLDDIVEDILNHPLADMISDEVSFVIDDYYSLQDITKEQHQLIVDCYVLLYSKYCVGEDDIYMMVTRDV